MVTGLVPPPGTSVQFLKSDVDSSVPADVIGHVFADPDDTIDGPDARGFGLAWKSAIGTERHGQRSARQIHHARIPGPQRRFEQNLSRVVGGSQDYFRLERFHLSRAIRAQVCVGDGSPIGCRRRDHI